MKISCAILTAIGLLLVTRPTTAQAIQEWDPVREYSTREVLQDLLDRLDKSASSSAYSATLRARAHEQAELIRSRLQEGDFQVGDQIILMVEDQPALSNTFTVDQGLILTLPTIGDVPLAGVLRSELKQHVSTHLQMFLREPIVRGRSLIRIAVLGGVARPGFYTIAGEALLTDAVMMAGGPLINANIDEIRVEREQSSILEGRRLQAAMDNGRTLDELHLRAGDRIFVPQRGSGVFLLTTGLRIVGLAVGVTLSVAALIQIF